MLGIELTDCVAPEQTNQNEVSEIPREQILTELCRENSKRWFLIHALGMKAIYFTSGNKSRCDSKSES